MVPGLFAMGAYRVAPVWSAYGMVCLPTACLFCNLSREPWASWTEWIPSVTRGENEPVMLVSEKRFEKLMTGTSGPTATIFRKLPPKSQMKCDGASITRL